MVVCTRDVRAHAEAEDTAQGSHQRESPCQGASHLVLGPVPKVMEGKAVPYYLGEAGLELGARKPLPPMRSGTPEASFRKWRDNS